MISPKTHRLSPLAADVFSGLTRVAKSLPAKLFYDEAGSELFEEITRLPEYYLTRTEQQILNEYADEIVRLATDAGTYELVLIELGAGSATKTRTVIRAILAAQPTLTFYPLDVSSGALRCAAEHLNGDFPALRVRPVIADYTAGLPLLDADSRTASKDPGTRKLVLYIGSSIGNFEPMAASALLSRISQSFEPGDALLLGTDLAKSPDVLLPAYDDAAGVTARFNKNLLARINRELGGEFDLNAFRHVALWNASEYRMEMYLESTRRQSVRIRDLDLSVSFAAGERIHTENSYKFTMPMISSILRNGGLRLQRTWTDQKIWFALHLATIE